MDIRVFVNAYLLIMRVLSTVRALLATIHADIAIALIYIMIANSVVVTQQEYLIQQQKLVLVLMGIMINQFLSVPSVREGIKIVLVLLKYVLVIEI